LWKSLHISSENAPLVWTLKKYLSIIQLKTYSLVNSFETFTILLVNKKEMYSNNILLISENVKIKKFQYPPK